MSASPFAPVLQPPYYAVVFSAQRTTGDHGYAATADRMVELARQQDGFLGLESTRDAEGFGITVSYWSSEAAIARWKAVAEHQLAQMRGHREWYADFRLRVCRVEREYALERGWPAKT